MQAGIAFIGCGRMASVHAAALRKIGGAEIVGAYDIVPEKGKAFAEKFGAGKVYSSRDELLADENVTAVAICDYGHQHAEEMLAVMGGGIRRIFCEKPAVRHFRESGDVLSAAKAAGCLVSVGHVRRYFAEQVKMKEIVESGILGRVLFAKVHHCNATFSREWGTYFSNFEQSGGTTLDMGVHYIDFLNWCFGRPESVSARVFGMEKRLSPAEKPCDYFSGNILYENGVICGLETSYQRYGAKADLIEIYGDKYTLVYDSGTLKLYNRETVTEYNIVRSDPHELQMRAFVKMIQDGTPCACMLEDGILSAETALGMLESSENETFHHFERNEKS